MPALSYQWQRYAGRYPAAVACLADDLDASLAHLRLPPRHRINARTTNLAERSFVEERRRSKVIPRFPDEEAAMKLVFAAVVNAVRFRWDEGAFRGFPAERAQADRPVRPLGSGLSG